tara:strand:- start:112 stop:477 length:366 start_codon:yes stop_codon:yes gene_type:complete
VLDLRVAQVADGALVAEVPEVLVADAERVPEAERRAEEVAVALGEGLELRLGVEGADGLGRGGRDVGGRGAAEGEGDEELGLKIGDDLRGCAARKSGIFLPASSRTDATAPRRGRAMRRGK